MFNTVVLERNSREIDEGTMGFHDYRTIKEPIADFSKRITETMNGLETKGCSIISVSRITEDRIIIYYKDNTIDYKRKVILLCGEPQYNDSFRIVYNRLVLRGNIVLIPDNLLFYEEGKVFDKYELKLLSEIHKSKIDICNAIYVVNPLGIIDDITKADIEYAKKLEKEIMYLIEV